MLLRIYFRAPFLKRTMHRSSKEVEELLSDNRKHWIAHLHLDSILYLALVRRHLFDLPKTVQLAKNGRVWVRQRQNLWMFLVNHFRSISEINSLKANLGVRQKFSFVSSFNSWAFVNLWLSHVRDEVLVVIHILNYLEKVFLFKRKDLSCWIFYRVWL